MTASAYRNRKKSPQSRVLLAIFFITLIALVVNQVFLNMQARQQQADAARIAELQEKSLQMVREVEVATAGDAAAIAVLKSRLSAFEAELAAVGAPDGSSFDTGFGVTLPLPPAVGYFLLFVLLLTIGVYGSQVIQQSREAEQFTAEKNKRNSEAVSKLIKEISSLADGDLTVEATIDEDFTGSIAESVNYAVAQLRGLVSAITEVTLQVTTATDSSTQRVEALSEASRVQSESIDAVYVSIREIGKDINLVSDNAQKSLKVAENSVVTAAGGADVVKDTIKGMDGIRDQIQDTSRRIKRLGESSQAIGSFVSLISDIAAHTNTLSLNAAIQAASAGEAGKGFAVVADEVHALAERSRDATRQIESLVKAIQGDIKEVVQSMEQTTAEVVSGTGLARKAGTALDDIQRVSKQLAELVSSITDASRNQSKAASELKGSMEVIRQVTLKTSSGIEDTRDFILKLGGLTERLKLAVAGFSLNKRDKWARLNLKKDNVMTLEPKKLGSAFAGHGNEQVAGSAVTA